MGMEGLPKESVNSHHHESSTPAEDLLLGNAAATSEDGHSFILTTWRADNCISWNHGVDISAWSSGIDPIFLHYMWHFTCIISAKPYKSDEDTVLERQATSVKPESANWEFKSSSGWFYGPCYFILVLFLTFYYEIISDLQKSYKDSIKNSYMPFTQYPDFPNGNFYHLSYSICLSVHPFFSPGLCKSKLQIYPYILKCIFPKNQGYYFI